MNNYSEQKAYILQDDWVTLHSIYEVTGVIINPMRNASGAILGYTSLFVGKNVDTNYEAWFMVSEYQDKLLTFEQIFNKIKGDDKPIT